MFSKFIFLSVKHIITLTNVIIYVDDSLVNNHLKVVLASPRYMEMDFLLI